MKYYKGRILKRHNYVFRILLRMNDYPKRHDHEIYRR